MNVERALELAKRDVLGLQLMDAVVVLWKVSRTLASEVESLRRREELQSEALKQQPPKRRKRRIK